MEFGEHARQIEPHGFGLHQETRIDAVALAIEHPVGAVHEEQVVLGGGGLVDSSLALKRGCQLLRRRLTPAL
jgi:hypothetical protein